MNIKDSEPRRTQAERSQKSREHIIREATRLFGERGYRGARLADVASAAGLTEPGLLHHFPSKEHVLMGVLEERDRIDRERFGAAWQGDGSGALDALAALMRHNETVPGLVQVFTVLAAESIAAEHPGHEFFCTRYQGLRQQLTDTLRHGQERGEIRADLPAESLAVMIIAMMDGLQVQWLMDPGQVRMAAVFEEFTRLLML